jgi:T5SS/PEP-CTERM-associated repeat protein
MSRCLSLRALILVSAIALLLSFILGGVVNAATYYSFTGSFTDGSEVQRFYFTLEHALATSEHMSFKTWHYNGGTNWAGQTIAGGNFDPTLGLYRSTGTQVAYNDDSANPPPYPYDSHIPRTLLPVPLNADNYYLELRSYWGDLESRGPDWAVDIEGPDAGTYDYGMHLTGVPAVAGSTLKSLYMGSDVQTSPARLELGAGQSLSFTEDVGLGFSGYAVIDVMSATMQCRSLYIGTTTNGAGDLNVDGKNAHLTVSSEIFVGYAANSNPNNWNYLLVTRGGLLDSLSPVEQTIANASGSIGQVYVDALSSDETARATWNSAGSITVGNRGKGSMYIRYGGLVQSPGASIAKQAGAAGSIVEVHDYSGSHYTPAQWNLSGNLYVGGGSRGAGDTGTLLVGQGGEVNVSSPFTLRIWSTGTVNLNGGLISAGSFVNSGGTFNHTNGELDIYGGTFNPGTTDYAINGAAAADYPAIYLFNGATFNLPGRLDVGRNHHGVMYVGSNSHATSSLASIGSYSGSQGRAMAYGSNAVWTINGTQPDGKVMWIGGDDYGDLIIWNGGKVELTGAYSRAVLGNSAAGYGYVYVSGSGSRFESRQDLLVGNAGHGVLYIEDGGAVAANPLDPGYYPTSVGEYAASLGEVYINGVASDGSRSQWIRRSNILVGFLGRGTVSITNGGLMSSIGGVISLYAGSAGSSVTLEGYGPAPGYFSAEWSASSAIHVGGYPGYSGDSGRLTVKQGGYVHTPAGLSEASKLQIWPRGTVELLGGTISTGSFVNSGGTFTHTDGILEVNGGTFDPGTPGYTIDGAAANQFPTIKLLNAASANLADRLVVGDIYNAALEIRSGSTARCLYTIIGWTATSSAGSAVTVDGPGSVLTLTGGGLYAGFAGKGSLSVSNGGRVDLPSGVDLDLGVGGEGQVVVDGANSTVAGGGIVIVGYGAKGTLRILQGGLMSGPSTVLNYLAAGPAANGTVEVSGIAGNGTRSRWISAGQLTVGYLGRGTLTVSQGAYLQSAGGAIGADGGSARGSATVGGAASNGTPAEWILNGPLYVGGGQSTTGAEGRLTVSDGGVVQLNLSNPLCVYSPGTVELLGGRITTGGFIVQTGGTFTHHDGVLEVDHGLFAPGTTSYTLDGAAADDLPTVKLLNGAMANISGDIAVGNLHKGQLEISGGSQLNCTNAYIGRATGSYGLVMIDGTSAGSTPSRLSATGPVYVGYNGQGALNISNGAVVESRGGAIASTAAAAGSWVFLGGTMGAYGMWNLSNTLYIGGSAAGPGGLGTLYLGGGVLLSSGSVKVYPQGTIDINSLCAVGLIELEGGKLTGNYWVDSNVISRNGTIDTDHRLDFQYAGLTIDNGYALYKTGDGRLQLEDFMVWGAGSRFYVMDGRTNFMLAAATVRNNASLIISQQGMVFAEAEDPFTDSTNPNLHVNVQNSGYLQITNGLKQVGILTGAGDTAVQAGAQLHADAIVQNVLTVGPGAVVVIRPIIGGPLAPQTDLQPVPEPSSILLAALAILMCSLAKRRKEKRESF